MIVTIHQPEHLPWLGFFDKMRQADVFVLLDTVQFTKNDFQNRNRIKTRHGATWLTVPIYLKGRSKQLIVDTEISNDPKWRKRSWSQIYECYRKAPYFDEHSAFFEALYAQEWRDLVDINIAIIQYLHGQLGMTTELVRASDLAINEPDASRLLLTLCQEFGADVYLSGSHGKNYLDETPFTEENIQVVYQDFQHPVYPQRWGDFLSHMSTIDLLFNCGAASLSVIAESNTVHASRPMLEGRVLQAA